MNTRNARGWQALVLAGTVWAVASARHVASGPATWQPLNATTLLQGNGQLVSGRVNAAVADPDNADVVYLATDGGRPTGPLGNPIGSPVVGLPDTGGGGVWKTTNWTEDDPKDVQWTALTDDQPSLSVGQNGLAMAPSDSSILYAAADSPRGCVLKSTDAGESWTALGRSLFAGAKFGGIAVDPTNPDVVYVAVFRGDGTVPGGVYKSINGGQTWQRISGKRGFASHVIVSPTNPDLLYAGFVDPAVPAAQGVWQSTDGGATWQNLSPRFPGVGAAGYYIEFAFAPSNPDVVYVIVMKPNGGVGNSPKPYFFLTTDGGQTFEGLCETSSDPDDRFWHQPLAVYPLNPEIAYAEGFNHEAVFTTVGGRAKDCASAWNIFWTTDDPVGYSFHETPGGAEPFAMEAFGDRGIYTALTPATDPGNLLRRHGNLANPLLETIAVDPSDPSVVYGVAFDQGAAFKTSPALAPFWQYLTNNGDANEPIGYEFGKVLIDPQDPQVVYNLGATGNQTAANLIQRSQDGGTFWAPMTTGLADADFPFSRSVQTDPAAWKAFEIDPSDPQRLLFGATRVYQWLSGPGQGREEWRAISPVLAQAADQTAFISALGIPNTAPKHVFAATSQGKLFAANPNGSWTQLKNLRLPPFGFISRIEISPTNANRVVVVCQGPRGTGRVWMTFNGGGNWFDATRNLPTGLQAYTLTVDWRFPNARLYVGTDRGVYISQLSAANWTSFTTGLPNTLVSDLRLVLPSGVLTAATFGRGAFQITLPAP